MLGQAQGKQFYMQGEERRQRRQRRSARAIIFSFCWVNGVFCLIGILAMVFFQEMPCSRAGTAEMAGGSMAAVPGKSETLVLTGGRFSGWQGGKRLYFLEVASLTAVPKQWGPFSFQELRDFVIVDCRLQVEEQDLNAIWQQIGTSLYSLARTPAQINLQNADQGGLAAPAAPLFRLVAVPPAITAQPFACRLETASGEHINLEADQASFQPSEPVLHLNGSVRLISSRGSSLESSALEWWFCEQKIKVPGPYIFKKGRKLIQGRQGHFSLAGGKLTPDKAAPTAAAPATNAAASTLPPFPVMAVNAALPGKKNPLVTFFSLMMLSSCSLGDPVAMAGPAGAVPPPAAGR
jgi:hypothetical protein